MNVPCPIPTKSNTNDTARITKFASVSKAVAGRTSIESPADTQPTTASGLLPNLSLKLPKGTARTPETKRYTAETKNPNP